jgi:hypothetical protein
MGLKDDKSGSLNLATKELPAYAIIDGVHLRQQAN